MRYFNIVPAEAEAEAEAEAAAAAAAEREVLYEAASLRWGSLKSIGWEVFYGLSKLDWMFMNYGECFPMFLSSEHGRESIFIDVVLVVNHSWSLWTRMFSVCIYD